MKWFRDESGQVLVMTFFSMALLLGFLGLAVDVGVLFHARRSMQSVADAAAMAGATEMFYNGSAGVQAKAWDAAKGMGVDHTVTGNTVNVFVSPTLPGGVACPSCVQVQVGTPNPTIFIATMSQWFLGNTGFNSVNVSANAVAGSPGYSNTCMYVEDPTDADTLWIHGAGDINAPGCGVYVNSNNPAALCVTGSAGKSDLSVIAVNGGQDNKGGCGGDPGVPVKLNSGVQSLPAAWQNIPTDPTKSCGTVTDLAASGGTITGSFNSGGSQNTYYCFTNSTTPCTIVVQGKKSTNTCTPVTLSGATLGPGIYVFETGVKITGATKIGVGSGDLTTKGQGATVVVTGDGIYDSGTATTFTDYAPIDGTYNGVAIYQPLSDTQPMMLQFGSGSSIFMGAVLAPGADVTLHDQGGAVNATDLIVGEIYVNGTTNLTNYSAYNPNTTPFLHITLVE